MELKRLKIEKDGSVESTWLLTSEQFQVLLNYAIDSLLAKGLITTLDIPQEELDAMHDEAEAEAQRELLDSLDVNQLPKA